MSQGVRIFLAPLAGDEAAKFVAQLLDPLGIAAAWKRSGQYTAASSLGGTLIISIASPSSLAIRFPNVVVANTCSLVSMWDKVHPKFLPPPIVGAPVLARDGGSSRVHSQKADSSLTLAGFTGLEWLGMTKVEGGELYRSAEALRHPKRSFRATFPPGVYRRLSWS